MTSSKNYTEVIIDGKVFTLSGFESEEYLQQVSTYLNHKISECASSEGYGRQSAETRNILLALNTSSIVLSADDLIEVEVCEGRYGRQEQVSLCFDGAEQTTLVTGERVCIKRSSHTAKLIKLSKESFMKTMRKKMKGN